MSEADCEDATIGMAEDLLRRDAEGRGRNGFEDRTAADVMRRNGFPEETVELCFGYRPITRMRPFEPKVEGPPPGLDMDPRAPMPCDQN